MNRNGWTLAFLSDGDNYEEEHFLFIEAPTNVPPEQIISDVERAPGTRVRWLMPMQPFLHEPVMVKH